MACDWTYNAPEIASHIGAAREFIDAAEGALEAGRPRAWAELAFAAAELLAKAELLPFPDEGFRAAKRHRSRTARLHEWASLGNIAHPSDRPGPSTPPAALGLSA
ncbi:MAG TPA: hypothetical protein VNT03_11015 [Baekduia sp.]|nr:hypothetical protein [Baekduia sp.]